MENMVYLFNFLGCAQILLVQFIGKRIPAFQQAVGYNDNVCEA